jgi:hypothetical protein
MPSIPVGHNISLEHQNNLRRKLSMTFTINQKHNKSKTHIKKIPPTISILNFFFFFFFLRVSRTTPKSLGGHTYLAN